MMARNTGGASRSSGGTETPEADTGATEARQQELVKSLRRAIDRRDQRIEKLTESLDKETRAAEALRRELDELGARVAGLERTLEHRTQTCHRLRELLREVRNDLPAPEGADIDMAEPSGPQEPTETTGRREQPRWPYGVDVSAPDAAPESAVAASAPVTETEPEPEPEAPPAHADRVVDLRPGVRALGTGPGGLVDTATVPDVAGELVSAGVMLGEADTDRALVGAVSAPAPRSGSAAAKLPSMALLSLDDDPPRKYAVSKEVVTIGRSRFSDLTIDSRLVSRLHARICIEDGRAVIEDLGSTNGIKVNSQRVERAELADGDLINLGRKRFRFVIDAA